MSTAARLCRRAGLARPKVLDPARPVVRYERENPGELLRTFKRDYARAANLPDARAILAALPRWFDHSSTLVELK